MGSLIEIGPTSLVVLIVLTSHLTSWTIASPVEKRGACKDTSPNCEKWATEGMCRQDPDMEAFMSWRCPFACDKCDSQAKREVIKRRAPAIAELRLDAAAIDDATADAVKRSEEKKAVCL